MKRKLNEMPRDYQSPAIVENQRIFDCVLCTSLNSSSSSVEEFSFIEDEDGWDIAE